MAPVSNAEGGGRLMLSKGIDAECVKAVCMCVCRVVSYPRDFPVCHQVWEGKERSNRLFLVSPHQRLV